MFRGVLALLAVALIMSGCGAAGHHGAVTTSTAATTTTIVPAGATQLTAIAIQPSDLPSGWTETDPGDSETGGTDNGIITSDMAQCVGVSDIGSDEVASADSGTFSLGINKIGSSATSYMSSADITTADALFSNPKFGSCVQSVFVNGLIGSGAVARNPVTTVTIGPGTGPPNVAATTTTKVTLVSSGIDVAVTVNLVFMTGPLVVGAAFFFGAEAPFLASVEAAVVAKMSARTAAAP